MASRVDVGSRTNEDVDHLAVSASRRFEQKSRTEVQSRRRLIDPGLQIGMTIQQAANARPVARPEGGDQLGEGTRIVGHGFA
jgi:hypothetical protein